MRRPDSVLEIQIQMAFSDGELSDKERDLLKQVSKYIGINTTHFKFILKRYIAEFEFHRYPFNRRKYLHGECSLCGKIQKVIQNNFAACPNCAAISNNLTNPRTCIYPHYKWIWNYTSSSSIKINKTFDSINTNTN